MREVDTGETKGMIRRVDDLGRIVIPMEFRKTLNIRNYDKLEIFMVQDGFFLKKVEDR